MIRVQYDDLTNFAVRLDRKSAQCKTEIKQAIQKSCLSIQRTAQQNLSKNGSVKTGHLRRSISHTVTATDGIVHTSNVVYAAGVEYGTKAHTIRAKNKKALYWQGANHPVKQVNHPGSKAKPYLIPGLEAEKPKFIENLKEAIQLDE